MDIDYIKKLSPAERKELLQADAIDIQENVQYTKPLTDDEVRFYKDELTENSILQATILEEKKLMNEAFKEKLKPVAQKISESLQAAKYKAITCTGTIYRLADYDQYMVHTVDTDGNLISSRTMLPAERQLRIQALKQQSA